jgi:hypothetical protein
MTKYHYVRKQSRISRERKINAGYRNLAAAIVARIENAMTKYYVHNNRTGTDDSQVYTRRRDAVRRHCELQRRERHKCTQDKATFEIREIPAPAFGHELKEDWE